jgi:hypothetical protein
MIIIIIIETAKAVHMALNTPKIIGTVYAIPMAVKGLNVAGEWLFNGP